MIFGDNGAKNLLLHYVSSNDATSYDLMWFGLQKKNFQKKIKIIKRANVSYALHFADSFGYIYINTQNHLVT